MVWIESHQEIAQHPKTKRLARYLGVSLPDAIGRLHLLWWWATSYAADGNLSSFDAADLADATLWEGDPDVLLDALRRAGFMDEDGRIHDWHEYAGRLLERRRQDAERKRMSRVPSIDRADTGVPSAGRPVDVLSPSGVTVPNRTGPDTTGPTGGFTAVDSGPIETEPNEGAAEAAPKVEVSTRASPKPNRFGTVIDLVRAANVPIEPTDRDAKAVKGCTASAEDIASAYVAACRGDWDPGGNGWLRGNLALHVVIARLAGYQASQQPSKPNASARASPPGEYAEFARELNEKSQREMATIALDQDLVDLLARLNGTGGSQACSDSGTA